MDEKKLPLDFSELTQEDIDRADSYKKVNEYDIMDLLKAIVDSSEEE
ncbi:MAG: hypothetical protein J6A15_01670 [Clostridia bacterium]|nr:hypothetical protein [Clostridia bacterium]